MGLSAVSWGARANLLLLSAVMNTYSPEKILYIHSCSRSFPNAALVGSVCSAPGIHMLQVPRYRVQPRLQGRRGLDFSDVGVLYMNKWNGLDNDVLTRTLYLPL